MKQIVGGKKGRPIVYRRLFEVVVLARKSDPISFSHEPCGATRWCRARTRRWRSSAKRKRPASWMQSSSWSGDVFSRPVYKKLSTDWRASDST